MSFLYSRSVFIACLLFSFGVAGADDLGSALMGRAGNNGLGYVRVENPKVFLEKLDGVTGKFGSRASDMLPMMAQQIFKNPGLAGVDMGRPWTFVFLDPRQRANSLAIVVGVNDATQFCDSFGKGGISKVQPDAATSSAAVRHFTESVEQFDQVGYMAALRAGEQADPGKFKKQITKDYYVTVRDNQGIIVGEASLLELPASSDFGPIGKAIQGDLVAAFHASSGLANYEKEIQAQKEQLLAVMQMASGRGAAPASPESTARQSELLVAVFDMLLDITRQVDWIRAGLTFDGGKLKVLFGAQSLPGTGLDKMLVTQHAAEPDPALLNLMPAEMAMLSTWHTVKTPEATAFMISLFRPFLQSTLKATPEKSEELLKAIEAFGTVYNGDMVAAYQAVPGKAGLDLQEVVRVSDAAQARQIHRKMSEFGLQMANAFLPGGANQKVKIETNVARHGGVEIDQTTMDMSALTDLSGGKAGPAMPFGSNMVSRVACTGQFELIALGPNGEVNINRLIDAVKSPVAAQPRPRFDAALASFPKQNNGVFFMDLGAYMKMFVSALPGAESAEVGKLAEMLSDGKVDLAGYMLLQPQVAMWEVDLPLEQLIGIIQKTAAPPAAAPVSAAK